MGDTIVMEELIGSGRDVAGPGSGDIRVDEEGEWYHCGTRVIREDIVRLFLENLVRRPDGGYVISWEGSECSVDVADTPFVVTRVDLEKGTDAGESVIRISLKYLAEIELLDPRSLAVGDGNVLYCRVRDGRFPARFSRPAYYQLAEWIVEDEETGSFSLQLAGRRYPIAEGDAFNA